MTSSRRFWNAAVAGPLAALLLVLSVAVPVLERADVAHGTVVESQHDPGSCPTPHDHTVCAQYGANQSASGNAPDGPHASLRSQLVLHRGVERTIVAEESFEAPARAPPST